VYPEARDGADVVEVMGRVHRPRGVHAGDRIEYLVALGSSPRGELQATEAVEGFFDAPGSLLLQTRDIFDNRYKADLLQPLRAGSADVDLLRHGQLARQERTHTIMTAAGSTDRPMPHMMGVHTFVTRWAEEEFFSVDLHIHNGFSGLDKDDPLDDALNELYFQNLELRVPRGWKVSEAFDSPLAGRTRSRDGWHYYSLVQQSPDGSMHVLPQQSRFVRRLVVHRESRIAKKRALATVREQTLGFCVPDERPDRTGQLYSWNSGETGRYYNQNIPLPNFDHMNIEELRQELRGDLEYYSEVVAEGLNPGYPVINPNLGWAHPWSVKYGGMTGGDEIYMYDGIETVAARAQAGYRFSQLVSRMYVDRQSTALINKNGDPTCVADWVIEPPGGDTYLHMWFFLKPMLPDSDPFGFEDAPTVQRLAVESQGKVPAYKGELEAYKAVDLQHYIRYTRHHKTLAWLGNDALSKFELRLAAEVFRLSYHEHDNSPYGHTQGSSLKSALEYVDEHPGWGVGFGRGNSWGLDAALAAYAMGDSELRARYYPWFDMIQNMLVRGQSDCTGVIMSVPQLNKADGQYRWVQTFETSFINNLLWGMRTTAFEGKDDQASAAINDVIEESVYAQVSPFIWRDELTGPVSYIALGPFDVQQPPFCEILDDPEGQDDTSDHTYVWSDMALGYALTQDEEFLFRATQAIGGGDLMHQLQEDGMGNIHSRVALLSLMQRLQGDE
jgi:hypothetical protein